MTEKEKMLAGLPYRSRDPELLAHYHRAKALLAQFSGTSSDQLDLKEQALRQLFGSLGTGVWVESPFFCDYGVNIHFGNNCFVNYNCVFVDNNRIDIGHNVLIGPAVQIYTATHPLLPEERISPEGYATQTRPVAIGDSAWIGGGVIILPGVTIGSGSTIGAGSVVTRDIPARCLAVGNPCKVIREL